MKRTNYFYPKQMLERLKVAKKRTGISVSELIRGAIEVMLQGMNL